MLRSSHMKNMKFLKLMLIQVYSIYFGSTMWFIKNPTDNNRHWSKMCSKSSNQWAPCPYLWAMWRQRVQWISYDNFLGIFYAEMHKLVVNTLLHKDTRGSRTALSLVVECSFLGFLHCQLHCGHTNGCRWRCRGFYFARRHNRQPVNHVEDEFGLGTASLGPWARPLRLQVWSVVLL